MNDIRRKDALTDLIDVSSSSSESQQSNNGTVSTPSGEKVELGFGDHIQKLAKKLVRGIQLRKKEEREVMEQFLKRK